MLRLTEHFREQWLKRGNGPVPGAREVEEMIEGSISLQKDRDVYTPRGRRFKVLALYWNPEKDVVFKVDERRGTVVTVISKDMNHDPASPEGSRRRQGAMPRQDAAARGEK